MNLLYIVYTVYICGIWDFFSQMLMAEKNTFGVFKLNKMSLYLLLFISCLHILSLYQYIIQNGFFFSKIKVN